MIPRPPTIRSDPPSSRKSPIRDQGNAAIFLPASATTDPCSPLFRISSSFQRPRDPSDPASKFKHQSKFPASVCSGPPAPFLPPVMHPTLQASASASTVTQGPSTSFVISSRRSSSHFFRPFQMQLVIPRIDALLPFPNPSPQAIGSPAITHPLPLDASTIDL